MKMPNGSDGMFLSTSEEAGYGVFPVRELRREPEEMLLLRVAARRGHDVVVAAIKVEPDRIRQIAAWIRSEGGAVTGMNPVEHGEYAERGIWLGRLGGDLEHAGIGDWIVRQEDGMFTVHTRRDFTLDYVVLPSS